MIGMEESIILAFALWPVLSILDYTYSGGVVTWWRIVIWAPLYIPIFLFALLAIPVMRFNDWLMDDEVL